MTIASPTRGPALAAVTPGSRGLRAATAVRALPALPPLPRAPHPQPAEAGRDAQGRAAMPAPTALCDLGARDGLSRV